VDGVELPMPVAPKTAWRTAVRSVDLTGQQGVARGRPASPSRQGDVELALLEVPERFGHDE